MNKSCSIFFYEGWLGVAPTVINLAKILANIGYSVIIYAGKHSDLIHPSSLDENITVVYFDKPKFVDCIKHQLWKIKLSSLHNLVDFITFAIQILLWNFKQKNESLKREVSIGIDTNGSILAWIESFIFKSCLVYLSLELTIENQFRKFDKIRQLLERLSFRNSSCLLIQDEDRCDFLCTQLKYKHHQVFYLPNTVDYDASIADQKCINNYFREVFQLDEEKYPYLVTQAGMLCDSVFAKELATAFKNIRNGFALIYHERRKRDLEEPYIKLLKEINSKNLFLSLNPLPYEQIHQVFDATTIGLALYREIDENYAKIAKASGKLSAYLQHGKPVIMSNLESLVKLNDKYKFGKVIQDISCSAEIESALQDIINNYELYSKNAKYCFEQEFMFSTKVEPFLNFINAY
ncbi:MAG: hypothetical protein IGS39_23305 [Calothrix sp. C42_A2020_038]|nr:hypothetical protein [Calothrix sp. C42_A2020_038]